MIPADNLIEDALRKLKKLQVNNCLDIRPYKRDRSVIIEKLHEGYNVYEDGFHIEDYKDLSNEELKKLLKVIQKREFPRSNIVRFTVLKSKNNI